MQRDRKLHNRKINKLHNSQRGYALLMLMLVVALITLGFLAVLPRMKQQVQRDREEEMRHRGNSYMRAIQHFYKKFGRYPSRVEELENTNNLRFIRKLYKDPINRDPATGKEKDFKLLHQTDISLNNGPVLPGQTAGLNGNAGQGGLPGQQGAFGGGAQGTFGGGGFGSSPQGGLGGLNSPGGQPQVPAAQTPPAGDADTSDAGTGPNGTGSPASGSPLGTPAAQFGGSSGAQVFGGGPILGVASLSKAKSIRVFFDKSHYNDWMFIYIPQADRGGLLVGPINPGMPGGSYGGGLGQSVGGLNGQGQGQTQGLGQGFGQGQGQGLGQSPNGGLQSPPGQTPQNPQQ